MPSPIVSPRCRRSSACRARARTIRRSSPRARAPTATLLARMLRIYGYYDAEVEQTIGGIETGDPDARRNQALRCVSTSCRGRATASARSSSAICRGPAPTILPCARAFGIQPGDPLDSDRIVAAADRARYRAGRERLCLRQTGRTRSADRPPPRGRAIWRCRSPPAANTASAGIASSLRELPLLRASGRHRPLPPRSSSISAVRSRICAGRSSPPGWSPASPSPRARPERRRARRRAKSRSTSTIAKAPLRTIAGAVGYDSGEGFRVEASWEHRNLFPPEGLLRVRGSGRHQGAARRRHLPPQ